MAAKGKKKETAGAVLGGRKVGPRSGFTKATFSLAPEQLAVVMQEAKERAEARGTFRPDASEVIRDALDDWIAKR